MKKTIILLSLFLSQLAYSLSPPTGSTEQHFCQGESWTLEDVIVNTTESGLTITWFTIDDNTSTPLPISTNLGNNTTYYAFQNTGVNAESLAITISFDAVIPAPTSNNDDPLPCFGNFTLADVPVFNTTGFTGVLWFSSPDTSFTPLPADTPLVDGGTYYAFQGVGSCAVPLAKTIYFDEVIPAPTGESLQAFCSGEGQTLDDLAVLNTGSFNNIFWFDGADQSTANQLDPLTELLVDGATYYAFQAVGVCAKALAITIQLFPYSSLPQADPDQFFCDDVETTLSDIYPNVFWFNINDNTGVALDPNIIVSNNTTYYAFMDLSPCAEGFGFNVFLIDCTAGINENELSFFKLYPNPVKNTLTIKINNQTNIDLVISDIHGRKVYKEVASISNNAINVNVSNLNSGVYIISLITDNHKSTKKFVKK